MSFSDMNLTYKTYVNSDGHMADVEEFKKYLLTQDTIIIPNEGKLLCSPWVSKKIHQDPELIKDKLFYKSKEKTYFIYSKYFPNIGEVKVLFDISPYITSQIIIIKIGLVFIAIVFILQFFAGKYISHWLLRDLKNISENLKKVDINTKHKHIIYNMPENDEIQILATALNRSYDTIESQTQQLKQFLTDVSHEFKTPLMGMSSEIDVLEKKREKKSLKESDIENFFSHARGNIKKLNSLLEALFYLSRVEQKNQCLIKTPIKLKAFIEEKIENISRGFPDKKIQLKYSIPKNFTLDIEEVTFSILLDNIISNAIKFSGNQVQLEFLLDKNSLIIQDYGIGIEENDLQKIWDKFYRKDYNKQWFWVGLYLVKRIVEIYGWEISVESQVTKGTKFLIIFSK